MTTKEQERKALEQIKKIVAGLGEDSYLAIAFDGCFEIADTNIENDWACSMKQRAESAEAREAGYRCACDEITEKYNAKIAEMETRYEYSRDRIKQLEDVVAEMKSKTMTDADLATCRQLVDNEACNAEKEMKAAANEIVTFAEEPESINFQKAVRVNRDAASRWNQLLGLKGRINKVLENRA